MNRETECIATHVWTNNVSHRHTWNSIWFCIMSFWYSLVLHDTTNTPHEATQKGSVHFSLFPRVLFFLFCLLILISLQMWTIQRVCRRILRSHCCEQFVILCVFFFEVALFSSSYSVVRLAENIHKMYLFQHPNSVAVARSAHFFCDVFISFSDLSCSCANTVRTGSHSSHVFLFFGEVSYFVLLVYSSKAAATAFASGFNATRDACAIEELSEYQPSHLFFLIFFCSISLSLDADECAYSSAANDNDGANECQDSLVMLCWQCARLAYCSRPFCPGTCMECMRLSVRCQPTYKHRFHPAHFEYGTGFFNFPKWQRFHFHE